MLKKLIGRIVFDRAGATAVEYGIILAMIFLAMVIAVAGVGNSTGALWNKVSGDSADAIAKSNASV